MRIILLSQHFPPEVGAPQIRLYEISKELIARGHQVEVITAFPHHPNGIIPESYKGKFYQYEELDGVPVHRTWIYPSQKGRFWKRIFSYLSFTTTAFFSVFKSKPADLIICTSPPLFLGITGLLASKMKRAKFIFNVADIWPASAVELGILNNGTMIKMAEWMEELLYRKAWKVAAATEGIRDYVVKEGKRDEDVFLLPNGVNTRTFKPLPENTDWLYKLNARGKRIFTYAGNMGYAQGLETLLYTAEILQSQHPEVHFLFVGEGPEKEQLVSLADELSLSNVTFHDAVPVTEMPNVFSITDFSIVPLRNIALFEGARPSKIFSALATGTPVLYCGAGESANLIEQNHCGLVAEPENSEDIARKIVDSLNLEQEEYEEMATNGRELAEREFSWSKIVTDLLEQIE